MAYFRHHFVTIIVSIAMFITASGPSASSPLLVFNPSSHHLLDSKTYFPMLAAYFIPRLSTALSIAHT